MRCEQQTVFEPFCGCGGMGRGFSAYFRITYAVDIMPAAVRTYGANFPETQVQQKDIRDISGVRGDFDGITGVIGGPPCGWAARINVKKRRNDPRVKLLFEFMRLVEEIKPRFFVLENVPYVPRMVKTRVEKIGRRLDYDARSLFLNAADFGAAQSRKRWIVIGVRGQRLMTPTQRKPRTVREAFSDIRNNWGLMRSSAETLRRLAATNSHGWIALSKGGFKNAIRLEWGKPSPAVVNLKKVYMVHPSETRNISPAEAAALQGFLSNYTWKGNETTIAQMIANAMPVELAESIASALVSKQLVR